MIFKLYKATDALRRLERFEQLLEIFRLLNIEVEKIKLLQEKISGIDVKKINKEVIVVELPKKQKKVISDFLK